jgi:hypothetical protein
VKTDRPPKMPVELILALCKILQCTFEDLVGAVHWKMLADLLGLADGTAHNWHKLNGGGRASYVASRLKASQAPTEPE